MSFRCYNQKIYRIICNTITMCNPNENDKELQDDDRITTYPHASNIPLIKDFDDKNVPDSIKELQKVVKSLIKIINFPDVT